MNKEIYYLIKRRDNGYFRIGTVETTSAIYISSIIAKKKVRELAKINNIKEKDFQIIRIGTWEDLFDVKNLILLNNEI